VYILIAIDKDGVRLSLMYDDFKELIERANKLSKQGFDVKIFKEIFKIGGNINY
jgi:uncharacterized protein (UPF0335 family)